MVAERTSNYVQSILDGRFVARGGWLARDVLTNFGVLPRPVGSTRLVLASGSKG